MFSLENQFKIKIIKILKSSSLQQRKCGVENHIAKNTNLQRTHDIRRHI
jgi:hypothetical protein